MCSRKYDDDIDITIEKFKIMQVLQFHSLLIHVDRHTIRQLFLDNNQRR